MFSIDWLKSLCVKRISTDSRKRPLFRPILESLEDRITPTEFATYTNVTVQIIPNLFRFTVTEQVTANVSVNGTIDPATGAFTPGSGPAVSTGNILFNLNNQQQLAGVNSNGQATASFTLPLFVLLTSQTLEASYQSPIPTTPPTDTLNPSTFLAPLYTNFDNLIFTATLSFGTLTYQQQTGNSNPSAGPVILPSFYTAQGETNNMGLLSFNYNDPGTITTFKNFGFTFPGSLAFTVGAYGPVFI